MDRCEPQDSVSLEFTQGRGLQDLESWEVGVAAFAAVVSSWSVSVRARFPRVSPPLSPTPPTPQECDHSNNERLEGAEIEAFLRRLLKRPELEAIFHRYSGEDHVLSASELLEFLQDQGEDSATLACAQQLIQTYELNETGKGTQVSLHPRQLGRHCLSVPGRPPLLFQAPHLCL